MVDSAHLFPKNGVFGKSNSLPTSGHYKANYESFPPELGRLRDRSRYLERDGILTRRLYPEVPPRAEYTLGERGSRLLVPVEAIVAWVQNEWPEIEKSRDEYDKRYGRSTGD